MCNSNSFKEHNVHTHKSWDADVLAIVDPHNWAYDLVNEALGDAQF